MKLIKKILGAILIVILIPIAFAFFMTSDVSDTADKFFDAVRSNNYDKAYSLLSIDFKKDVNKSQLKLYLEANALNKVKDTSWNNKSINANRAKVIGTATTDTGISIPISITFEKGTNWKINSIKKLLPGVDGKEQIPSEEEQRKLVGETMHIFALSVKEQSMQKLYNHISNVWRRQWTINQFEKTFSSFYKLGSALMVVDRVTPELPNNATITKDDTILIKGIYPTKPSQLDFEHEYIYEGLGWKLVGLSVKVK